MVINPSPPKRSNGSTRAPDDGTVSAGVEQRDAITSLSDSSTSEDKAVSRHGEQSSSAESGMDGTHRGTNRGEDDDLGLVRKIVLSNSGDRTTVLEVSCMLLTHA